MTDDYCKLASGIILSTIWREDDHTRILWVTMLAVKGRDHRVRASVPGLAAVANIPLASCRAGLVKLMEPDPDSRTKDHEGRRIAEVEDGWLILNGEKYRNFLSKQERNEYQAKLMAERRALAKLAPVSRKLAQLGQAEAEAEAEAEVPPPKEHTSRKSAAPPDGVVEGKESTATAIETFEQFWQAYPKKRGKGEAEKAWKVMKCSVFLPKILVAVRAAKISPDWTKEFGQFIPHPATWLNRRGWEDEYLPLHSAQQAPAAVKGHV